MNHLKSNYFFFNFRKEVSSFGNHGLESPEVKKEKRLAALFGMDESDDEQGSSSAIPNAEDKPSTSTTSAFLHSTQQCIPSSTEGFSRSQALQSSLCVGASSSTRNTDSSGFRILPTQSDAEDEIVPSGASNFVPETPESLIRIGTLQAQPQQLGTSSGSREKRKQEDQDEVRDSIPKKRRVLTNNNEPVEAQVYFPIYNSIASHPINSFSSSHRKQMVMLLINLEIFIQSGFLLHHLSLALDEILSCYSQKLKIGTMVPLISKNFGKSAQFSLKCRLVLFLLSLTTSFRMVELRPRYALKGDKLNPLFQLVLAVVSQHCHGIGKTPMRLFLPGGVKL